MCVCVCVCVCVCARERERARAREREREREKRERERERVYFDMYIIRYPYVQPITIFILTYQCVLSFLLFSSLRRLKNFHYCYFTVNNIAL